MRSWWQFLPTRRLLAIRKICTTRRAMSRDRGHSDEFAIGTALAKRWVCVVIESSSSLTTATAGASGAHSHRVVRATPCMRRWRCATTSRKRSSLRWAHRAPLERRVARTGPPSGRGWTFPSPLPRNCAQLTKKKRPVNVESLICRSPKSRIEPRAWPMSGSVRVPMRSAGGGTRLWLKHLKSSSGIAIS